jgi:hypothetical protein
VWTQHIFRAQINVREYRRGNQNGQSRETGNIGYTRQRQTKQKHNTICVGHHYTQTNTNNVNKTWALLQTTEGKYDWTPFYSEQYTSYMTQQTFIKYSS